MNNRVLTGREVACGVWSPTPVSVENIADILVESAKYRVFLSDDGSRQVVCDLYVTGVSTGQQTRTFEIPVPIEPVINFGASYRAFGITILIAENQISTNTGAVLSVAGTKRVRVFGNISSFAASVSQFFYDIAP